MYYGLNFTQGLLFPHTIEKFTRFYYSYKDLIKKLFLIPVFIWILILNKKKEIDLKDEER